MRVDCLIEGLTGILELEESIEVAGIDEILVEETEIRSEISATDEESTSGIDTG